MARIHQLGIQSADNNNLLELAGYLAEAVTIVLEEGLSPHDHPIIRLISYQIAFAGDGDIELLEYYRQVLDYCKENADFEQPIGEPPRVKDRQTS